MRNLFILPVCGLVLGLSAYLGSSKSLADPVTVRLRLVDAKTGKDVGGIVRVTAEGKEEPLQLAGLFDRLRGLSRTSAARSWYVVPPKGAEVRLPRARLHVEAVQGLETAFARQELDLRDKTPEEVVVKLDFLFRPEQEGLTAGNTHLHLRDLSKDEADEYLRRVPAADGLRVMFISYLERKDDDKSYITNRYPVGEPAEFRGTGVLFNNGGENGTAKPL